MIWLSVYGLANQSLRLNQKCTFFSRHFWSQWPCVSQSIIVITDVVRGSNTRGLDQMTENPPTPGRGNRCGLIDRVRGTDFKGRHNPSCASAEGYPVDLFGVSRNDTAHEFHGPKRLVSPLDIFTGFEPYESLPNARVSNGVDGHM